jgi:hypothetical protein
MHQVPVFFENVPENIRHSEHNAGVRDVRQLGPTVPVAIEALLDTRS